jgi:hypothetical protein
MQSALMEDAFSTEIIFSFETCITRRFIETAQIMAQIPVMNPKIISFLKNTSSDLQNFLSFDGFVDGFFFDFDGMFFVFLFFI